MECIIYNGKISVAGASGMPPLNRSFYYGDGVFETMRYASGAIRFLDAHFNRLLGSLHMLKIPVPQHFTAEYIGKMAVQLAETNGVIHGRIRLTCWRTAEGYYTPQQSGLSFSMEASSTEHAGYPWNVELIRLAFYHENHKPLQPLSSLKSANALLYVLAGMHARTEGADDSLIFNADNEVIESTHSNIFIIKDGIVRSPPVASGCVDGIMRGQVIRLLHQQSIPFAEAALTEECCRTADEIFLTNAIRGITGVKSLDATPYRPVISKEISDLLNKSH